MGGVKHIVTSSFKSLGLLSVTHLQYATPYASVYHTYHTILLLLVLSLSGYSYTNTHVRVFVCVCVRERECVCFECVRVYVCVKKSVFGYTFVYKIRV